MIRDMTTLHWEYGRLVTFVRSRFDLLRERGEEGLTTAEWVVLVAAVVAMAIAAAGVIASKVSNKTNTIDL